MNFTFRRRDALEDGDGPPLHPVRKLAAVDEFLDFPEGASVLVLVLVGRLFVVALLVPVRMMALVRMAVPVAFVMVVAVVVGQMHVELGAGNVRPLLAGDVQVEFAQPEFFQLMLEAVEVHAQVEQRAQKHVAADTAEDVEVKCFHCNSPAASALIWLAA